MSSKERIPPPTVSGRKSWSAARLISSMMIPAFFLRSRDIEEYHFISALLIVAFGQLDRVTGIPQAEKIRPLDHPPVLEIQAGNDPSREHHW